MSDELIEIGDGEGAPDVAAPGVYGAPRPAVPERVPLAPRTKGCASGGGDRRDRRPLVVLAAYPIGSR